MTRSMSGHAKVWYANLVFKITVLLGGLLMAFHFYPDYRFDQTVMLGNYDLFSNIDTTSGLFAIFFGMFAVIGYIEGRYAWDRSEPSMISGVKLGGIGAMVGFIIMAGGIGFAVEELFIGQDFKDLNWWKGVYLFFGVVILIWLGKEELIFNKRSVDMIYGKTNAIFG